MKIWHLTWVSTDFLQLALEDSPGDMYWKVVDDKEKQESTR